MPATSPVAAERLLTPDETAELLGVTSHTLSVWRCTARYPLPYVKVGSRAVRYKLADVQRFIDEQTVHCGAAEA